MFHNASTGDRRPRQTAGRLAWSAPLALVIMLGASGCEDKAIGRTCDLTTDAGPLGALQAAYAVDSRDCPSGICTKPAVQPGVSNELTTGPYCTVRCNSDSDCDGQTRDFTNPNDRRCLKGFTCAIPFGEGPLCCAKLCLCKDFYSASVGPAVPDACQADAGATCS
jgi:hypothetical protein